MICSNPSLTFVKEGDGLQTISNLSHYSARREGSFVSYKYADTDGMYATSATFYHYFLKSQSLKAFLSPRHEPHPPSILEACPHFRSQLSTLKPFF